MNKTKGDLPEIFKMTLTRRQALSVGIKVGIAAGAGVVVGFVGGYFIASTPTKSVSTTTYTPPVTKMTTVKTGPLSLGSLRKLKSKIKTEVSGLTVYYREEDFWNEDDFPSIMENKEEFASILTENFISKVSAYGEEVADPKVEFRSSDNSTIFICEVHGAISKSGNRYYATFEWLIRPLGLDFIDDHFEESLNGLSWRGEIDGVPTEIVCEFPYTGLPYKAWASPTGHCHAHVWWELERSS